MKKTIKRFLCVVMCFVLILPFALSAAAAGIDTGFTQEDFLITKGNKIYNQKGEEIILRGVNLGSWLIQEDWLSPYEEAQDHHDMLEVLIDRFGTETERKGDCDNTERAVTCSAGKSSAENSGSAAEKYKNCRA